MEWRAYPVLPDDDPRYAEFELGLRDGAARVLAYLAARRDDPEIDLAAATRLPIRVGTGLGREPTTAALSTLKARGLVGTTAVARDAPGRPPKGWVAAADAATLPWRVRATHATALLERAAELAGAFGVEPPDGWLDGVEPPTAPVDDAVPLEVGLNWTPNGLHAPLIAADALGVYDEHGLAVDLAAERGSGAALDALRSGRVDVAVVGAASLCRAERGAFLPLALLRRRSLALLYTTTERLGEPFVGVEQLRGRRLATTPDSEVGRLARLFLSRAGVLAETEVAVTDGEERERLLDGSADVATGMPVDAHELTAEGFEVSTLSVSDHFPVPGPALVTTSETAVERPDALARLLAGTVAGAAAARRDVGRVAALVADRSGEEPASERRRVESAVGRTAEPAPISDRGWGWQTADDWERIRAALEQEAPS